LSIEDMVEEVNEKHMGPWGEACQCDGVNNTPLTPYIEKVHFSMHILLLILFIFIRTERLT